MFSSRPGHSSLNCDNVLKRRLEESSDEALTERKKGYRLVVLEPEMERSECSDSETAYSVQELETDFVKDTSDTSSHCDDEEVEFTVAYSDSSNKEKGSDSASSGSKTFKKLEIASVIILEDLGLLAGSSESDAEMDTELPRADFWTCQQCKATKNNPRFGVCERCFKARRSNLPPRPVRKKLRKRNGANSITKSSQASVSEDTMASQSSQATASQSSQATASQLSQASASSSQASSPSQGEDGKKCEVCVNVMADGIFIHGKSAHNYACYKCSQQIYKATRRCPICNQRVNNVVQLYR